MRTLIITTLILTSLALQSAIAAQVTGSASVRILEPIKISMQLPVSESTNQQASKANSINHISISADRDHHYVLSYNTQDTCSLIGENSKTSHSRCSTATVNFN
ncbi:MAG: hypothetical protein OEX12_00815 [Gammaproteobacteria bacterium]|nr:hypothetical protein [Gammaproteobacteria bacterium]